MGAHKKSEQAQTSGWGWGASGKPKVTKCHRLMSHAGCWVWQPIPPEKQSQLGFFSQSRRVRENKLFHCSLKSGPPERPVGEGSQVPQLVGEALGGVASICTGDSEFLSPSFILFSPRPSPPLPNSLPSPTIALSSLLLHSQPKVLFLDSRWSGFEDPPSHTPHPQCPGLGQRLQDSSLLASTQHDLGDEVNNG